MKLCPAARIGLAWMSCVLLSVCATNHSVAQKTAASGAGVAASQPWMNTSLDPDTRADMMVKEMTIDEKIQLVHGAGWGVLRPGAVVPAGDNGGAGFVAGIPRLGLPDINLADSAEIGRAHV